jgi:predicted dehydrogenase
MRIAFIGVSHWHAPLYYRPAVRLSDVRVVGVSDPDEAVARRVGAELDVPGFADYRALIEATTPDFAFVFGRHCDLAGIAGWLIERGVPMLLEKPGGMNAAEVAALRDQAAARGAYVGVGFNFRAGDMCRSLQAAIGDDALTFAAFRYIGGGPYRYRESGCAWMLDPAQSGGGCTINLAVHFFDLFRLLSRAEPTEVAALMGHTSWNLPVEDFSAVTVRAPGAVCTVETGYAYPADTGAFDLHFSLRTTRSYIVVRADGSMEVHRLADGVVARSEVMPRNAPLYPLFVQTCIDRFARGEPPPATLDDLTRAMMVVDAAYAADRAGGTPIGRVLG